MENYFMSNLAHHLYTAVANGGRGQELGNVAHNEFSRQSTIYGGCKFLSEERLEFVSPEVWNRLLLLPAHTIRAAGRFRCTN